MQKNKSMKPASLIKNSAAALICTVLIFTSSLSAFACDACQKQQPRFLQGITHGAGPGSNWDYLIVSIMTAITLYALYATVKCMVRPSAADSRHNTIKTMIFNQ